MYKDKGGWISLGPLWDFDSGFGWNYQNWLGSGFNDHFNHPDKRPPVHAFFKRCYDDPIFLVKYKETWNAKYDTIAAMPAFFDTTAEKLAESAEKNFESWWYKTCAPFTDTRPPAPNDFRDAVKRLKTWYSARVFYLNAEFNKVDVIPKEKDFDTAKQGYNKMPPQTFALVSYGKISGLAACLLGGDSSAFKISSKFSRIATGGGGYLATIDIAPKHNLPADLYTDTLVLSGKNQGNAFSLALPLAFSCAAPAVAPDVPDAKPEKKCRWPWRC
jgi:hypothetical protein